jgi:hypothetical protein
MNWLLGLVVGVIALVVWLIQPSFATAQGTSGSRFGSMLVGHHWHQRAVSALAHL